MVDAFVVLMLPGAGDELQGIKKGILELADLLVVHKADGEQLPLARAAAQDYNAALRYLPRRDEAWSPRALLASARTGEGLDELWEAVLEHRAALEGAGVLDERRRAQRVRWMWSRIEEALVDRFRAHEDVQGRLEALTERVAGGELAPEDAAAELLAAFAAGR